MIGRAIRAKNIDWNAKKQKRPPNHQKIKCLSLDYIQLLMTGQASQWTQTPSATLSSPKNEMFIFGLHSTSDDQLSNPSTKHWPKCKTKKQKWPPKSFKNQRFVFALHSTSDDWPSDLSKKCRLKCKQKQKRPPKSSKNKMFIFGLRSTSDDQPSNLSKKHQLKCKKTQKGPLSHWKIKCLFWIMFNFWWSAEQSEQKNWPKCNKKNKKAP